ncbi:cytochrome c [Robbsia sp. Bb-Pol-6]|uniref:Cytochrome c n=1 Tax=Robbsia betulipollinis TaxID=2981849 RepID=A0ABT3ZJZ6_9BURK|nr:cytochrome c [Robbsia betulipollinis]MCY0386836.1 cytochrome c [Robbsia betulipollinis]
MKKSRSRWLTAGAVTAAALTLGAVALAAPSLTVPAPPAAPMTHLNNIAAVPVPAIAVLPADDTLAARADTGAETSGDRQQLLRGAYLARAGDCIACHTAKNGTAYAGGLSLASPIGTIYSTNITPDKTHGIGAWTYDDFAKLMRTGVTRAGYSVYPAMPYPSYSRLNDDDMHALYAYFMRAVPASAQANRRNGIRWPLSMRWPLAIWGKVFAPAPIAFTPPPGMDAQTARGAYLVEGLGHCGSCHTPRSATMQEKAPSDDASRLFLSGGGAIDGWTAPSLRNESGGGLAGWSDDAIVDFLRTGRNEHAASFGAMNDVVVDSMQYLSDADLHAIAKYLRSLSPHDTHAPAYAYDDTVAARMMAGAPQGAGERLYLDRCAACHRANGTGYGRAFPPLAGNPVLQTKDGTSAIHIVLSGGAQPATHAIPSALSMAPYADLLNDRQVAAVVSFIQTGWGNRGGAVSAADVARVRKTALSFDANGLSPVQKDPRHEAPGQDSRAPKMGQAD